MSRGGMGFRDKLLNGSGILLLGAVAGKLYRDSQETKRRKNSPLCFDEGLTQSEFIEIAHKIAKRTSRVSDAVVAGMVVTLHVASNSGLSTWSAQIDYNDYGHLTGTYWLYAENSDSLIPRHFANEMRSQIEKRVKRTAGGRVDPVRRGNMATFKEWLSGFVGRDATAFDPRLGAVDPAATEELAEPPVDPTRHMGPAAARLPGNHRSKRRWIPTALIALLVVGLGGTYLVSQIPEQGSNAKTFSCRADGFTGYIQLSDTTTSIVSYKIDPGDNAGGNSADISVLDGGVTPPRAYRTSEGIQDSAYHALEGPYNRSGGGFSFTFVFDKSNRNDPTCSVDEYLAG